MLDAPQIIETAPQPASASHRLDSIGKSIFPEFRKAGSEWLTGDTYLFIVDMKGMSLFNAGFPKVEGTDLSGLKRFQRQVVVQELMKTAQCRVRWRRSPQLRLREDGAGFIVGCKSDASVGL